MTHNFVNDVLDGGFVAVAEVITSGSDLVDLVLQKLHKVAVFVSGHKGHRPHEAMPTLPSFCERIGQVWEPLIELLCGLMYGIRARIEMDAVGDITGQEEHSDEICGFHIGNDTAWQRSQATFLRKGVVFYIG
jgi:hypothetical protein